MDFDEKVKSPTVYEAHVMANAYPSFCNIKWLVIKVMKQNSLCYNLKAKVKRNEGEFQLNYTIKYIWMEYWLLVLQVEGTLGIDLAQDSLARGLMPPLLWVVILNLQVIWILLMIRAGKRIQMEKKIIRIYGHARFLGNCI